jgi:hypothetical protein
MIIEKFYRNITQDPHWVMQVKAKWEKETIGYIVSFESYNHPYFTTETFVCVRVWEADRPWKAIEKTQFLADLDKVKKRLKVNSVIDIYQLYKKGVCCDNI